MTADVIRLREPATGVDTTSLLTAISELHVLITLDPVLGTSPVRVYFVLNPQAKIRIEAALDASCDWRRQRPSAYALIAYDFPFALYQMEMSGARLVRERAQELVSLNAGLQGEFLEAAAASLGIAARAAPGFDADSLKSVFFPNTQETVIGLFGIDLVAS